MDVKEEQCVVIKFCCKVDFSATKTVKLIQKTYGDAALSWTTIFEWHKRFREGRESVKDECSVRPTTSQTNDNIATVDKMAIDQNMTPRLIAETLRQSVRALDGLANILSRLEKLCFQKWKVKTMLIVFFDSQGIVHKEFVQEGCTVNAEYYKGVSDRLISHFRRVRHALYCTHDFSLLHDNTPAHSAAKIRQFQTQ